MAAPALRNRIANFYGRVAPTDLVPIETSEPLLTICFDDFPQSAVSIGAEVLDDFGCKGTFYASFSFFEKTVDGAPYFDHDDLLRLTEGGHEIGCHTFSHVSMFDVTPAAIGAEIEDNRRHYEDCLPGAKFSSFAYPYGHMTMRAKKYLQSEFVFSRGTHAAVNVSHVDRAYVQAIPIETHCYDTVELARWLRKAQPNTWTVFLCHHVAATTDPSRYQTSHRLIETILREGRKRNMIPVTMAGASRYVA